MKNIFLLPTDKPSKLYLVNTINQLNWSNDYLQQINGSTNQNIYVTNDEEIKEGDYACYIAGFIVQKVQLGVNVSNLKAHKKIISTTDQNLIKDGVQAIDDEFLEWFINNSSCEEVEVQKWFDDVYFLEYKIIIPEEEHKQETIEEAVIRISKKLDYSEMDLASFKLGTKWQKEQDLNMVQGYLYANLKNIKLLEKSYSEEDMKKAFTVGFQVGLNDETSPSYLEFEEWFNQFKNK